MTFPRSRRDSRPSASTARTRSASDTSLPAAVHENVEKGSPNSDAPAPVGFWHPSLSRVRFCAMKKWTIVTLILMTFILGVLSLYWAVLFHVPQNLHALTIYVVDFDAPTNGDAAVVGPAVSEVIMRQLERSSHLGFEMRDTSEFGGDILRVREAVYEWDAWAAIIVCPNATEALFDAVQSGNVSYDPLGAAQVVYQSARDQTVWQSYISPAMDEVVTEATTAVGTMWTRMVLGNVSLVGNAAMVPQALSPAIGFSRFDLRPFTPEVAIPAVSIGLIYIIILSFFSFPFYMPIHMQYLNPQGHPPLKVHQLVIWRWCATVSAYFMLSLAYSLVSMAFGINFYHSPPTPFDPLNIPQAEMGNAAAYDHGTFLVYWMLNFFGMIALGLACENVAMVIGQPWTGLWLIFWVITNVCTSFYDLSLTPRFFHWGYAWPLHNIVEGSRQILFDLHSRLGLNFGILIAWGAVNTALFPFCCWFLGWKTRKGVHEYFPMHGN